LADFVLLRHSKNGKLKIAHATIHPAKDANLPLMQRSQIAKTLKNGAGDFFFCTIKILKQEASHGRRSHSRTRS
jgi:hypothetical protein